MADAAFAQPSGLALDGGTLFVADAESNVIRAVELPPVNLVTTVAGGDLFEFGDVDEAGDRARFQHPLGVAVHDGLVYVAEPTTTRFVSSIRERAGSGRLLAMASQVPPTAVQPARVSPSPAAFRQPAVGSSWPTRTTMRSGRSKFASGEVKTLELGGLQPPSA